VCESAGEGGKWRRCQQRRKSTPSYSFILSFPLSHTNTCVHTHTHSSIWENAGGGRQQRRTPTYCDSYTLSLVLSLSLSLSLTHTHTHTPHVGAFVRVLEQDAHDDDAKLALVELGRDMAAAAAAKKWFFFAETVGTCAVPPWHIQACATTRNCQSRFLCFVTFAETWPLCANIGVSAGEFLHLFSKAHSSDWRQPASALWVGVETQKRTSSGQR